MAARWAKATRPCSPASSPAASQSRSRHLEFYSADWAQIYPDTEAATIVYQVEDLTKTEEFLANSGWPSPGDGDYRLHRLPRRRGRGLRGVHRRHWRDGPRGINHNFQHPNIARAGNGLISSDNRILKRVVMRALLFSLVAAVSVLLHRWPRICAACWTTKPGMAFGDLQMYDCETPACAPVSCAPIRGSWPQGSKTLC